jgi:hypothetical protein
MAMNIIKPSSMKMFYMPLYAIFFYRIPNNSSALTSYLLYKCINAYNNSMNRSL